MNKNRRYNNNYYNYNRNGNQNYLIRQIYNDVNLTSSIITGENQTTGVNNLLTNSMHMGMFYQNAQSQATMARSHLMQKIVTQLNSNTRGIQMLKTNNNEIKENMCLSRNMHVVVLTFRRSGSLTGAQQQCCHKTGWRRGP